MYYKKYQQVINLSVGAKSAKNSSSVKDAKINKPEEKHIKRRTKTGCLTCRKRKKKCDEDKVDGKCQACTRNFLQCCWPETASRTAVAESPVKVEILTKESCKEAARKAYPSPTLSPSSTPKAINAQVNGDINRFSLPPSYNRFKFEAYPKPEIANKPNRPTKFVVTSFDSNKELCQV